MWTFALLTFGVIVMGILFVLSSHYGNVANALTKIKLEVELMEETRLMGKRRE